MLCLNEKGGVLQRLERGSSPLSMLPMPLMQIELPSQLKGDDEYNGVMGEILDNIHWVFFKRKEYLTSKEWQSCIMIFYHFQRQELKFRMDPPIGVESNPCKDDFDRGGGQNLVFNFHLSLPGLWKRIHPNVDA